MREIFFCPTQTLHMMCIILMLTRMEMIGVDENDNKPEPIDASQDRVKDFNEDTCNVSAYDF